MNQITPDQTFLKLPMSSAIPQCCLMMFSLHVYPSDPTLHLDTCTTKLWSLCHWLKPFVFVLFHCSLVQSIATLHSVDILLTYLHHVKKDMTFDHNLCKYISIFKSLLLTDSHETCVLNYHRVLHLT